ncbi:hypothetical protein A2767_01290 [Candidatus Roizmanbacteria bacterium RIFCSPHIGHO2_01_FULL_35_10]|uniref:BrnT family toxin n=1 Tax=Candidatus Roizmanbacteria bacterium RIFCSPLOWO2_01_FULL_35_13 TaxID=1802055 RepID=A0A1F7I7Q0_9BACT|nr:MAG: hypothetical protein A2767_01290 [Candidatus Roizmanbacteria bacterium RIFCSPHIGHO2_01_FULL_35_10]OGK39397.1 MAG: hypothetical protein A3A74_06195 [Candidatus Roizmanbacteria bacterium RIFCSPLOWO2_01_FULL_35_13]
MIDFGKIIEFEWDEANIDKSFKKHGITIKEAEELFLDQNILFLEDIKHSQVEKRYNALGISGIKILFAVFTLRKSKIRIISIRIANQKERRLYEKS